MLFSSWQFALFFALVFTAYLALKRWLKLQNALLLVASYVFYGWWDWRFLGLILFSTGIDYFAARKISVSEDERTRKRWLMLSVISNLGLLAYFKYTNFFLDSLRSAFAQFGGSFPVGALDIILPVGISFYTFQSLSYTVDVYRKETRASTNFAEFALYVSFFPQLVAGPIERSSHFLPQVENPRKITPAGAEAGIFLIIWGLFKKLVIADNAALIANPIFEHPTAHGASTLLLGALAFTIQIYGDFSGYSDMARGLSKLMGFDLMLNFKLPYFAQGPSDFWRRWHVSLSSWLRDYLYIPLGGNRGSTLKTYRNLFLTMLLGGLWHGAAWNFVAWGAYHGALLCGARAAGQAGVAIKGSGKLAGLARASLMFPLTVIGWILFRVGKLSDAGTFLGRIASGADGAFDKAGWAFLAALATPLILMQILQLQTDNLLAPTRFRLPVRAFIYGALIAATVGFATGKTIEFIYFQF